MIYLWPRCHILNWSWNVGCHNMTMWLSSPTIIALFLTQSVVVDSFDHFLERTAVRGRELILRKFEHPPKNEFESSVTLWSPLISMVVNPVHSFKKHGGSFVSFSKPLFLSNHYTHSKSDLKWLSNWSDPKTQFSSNWCIFEGSVNRWWWQNQVHRSWWTPSLSSQRGTTIQSWWELTCL